jgi:carbon storage regulator CsrA
MLVLSRRPDQDILFPNCGIRVRLLGLKGNTVRVGIEAPPEVEVFRGEIAPPDTARPAPADAIGHAVRNRLNKVTLSLHRFQQQWRGGRHDEAEQTLRLAMDSLLALDREWPSPPPPAPEEAARRCRALLVEDDDNERELLAGLLGMNGCDCDTAADGQDALDYLARHEPPDLVLLDMAMPRLSGPEMLRRLRQAPRLRDLKVFAISGASPSALGVSVGNGGVDAWFTKPVSPARLWEAIQQAAGSAAN